MPSKPLLPIDSNSEALRHLSAERYTFQDAANHREPAQYVRRVVHLAKLANIPEQTAVHFAYNQIVEPLRSKSLV